MGDDAMTTIQRYHIAKLMLKNAQKYEEQARRDTANAKEVELGLWLRLTAEEREKVS